MHRGYFNKRIKNTDSVKYGMDKSIVDNRRGRRRGILSPSEKLGIAYAMIVEHR